MLCQMGGIAMYTGYEEMIKHRYGHIRGRGYVTMVIYR
jgi:hypothetical protein